MATLKTWTIYKPDGGIVIMGTEQISSTTFRHFSCESIHWADGNARLRFNSSYTVPDSWTANRSGFWKPNTYYSSIRRASGFFTLRDAAKILCGVRS